MCNFQNQDADGTKETLDPNVSISSGVITITVGNKNAVTNGTFLVIYS